MTVKELIKMLQQYPDQNRKVVLVDSENGEEDPSYLEDQRAYVGCMHYPKYENGFPIPKSGTYHHGPDCILETYAVALRS